MDEDGGGSFPPDVVKKYNTYKFSCSKLCGSRRTDVWCACAEASAERDRIDNEILDACETNVTAPRPSTPADAADGTSLVVDRSWQLTERRRIPERPVGAGPRWEAPFSACHSALPLFASLF